MARVTIKDVAKSAGVDVATVSRALSNKPYVALETRTKIAAVVEALGYRPSAAARAMVSKRTKTIAMLVPSFTDAAFDWITAGAERMAREAGYRLLIASVQAVEGEFFSEDRADGLLIIDPRRFQIISSLPSVSLEDVPMDNIGGAQALALHLQQLGHDNVAMIGGLSDSPYSQARLAGIREIFPNALWLAGDWTIHSGYQLLQNGLPSGVTALLAANDFIAVGVIRALFEQGLSVPKDISVTGFDDEPIAKYLVPTLTTVRQDLELQGARAMSLLLEKLEQKTISVLQTQPLELIVRESSGKRRIV
jgi:DNA-binding LacI/PurR family transcriptional regulator